MNIWREAGANGLAILDKNSILLADTGSRVIQSLDLKTKKKTPFATVRRQEVLEPERRGAHEIRRGVPHRSAVRLQEIRRRAGERVTFNGVYRVAKDGRVRVVEKELHRPNGVALSPDERTLYVAQSEPTKAIIMAYSLDADGNVTGKKLFHDFTDLVGEKAPGLPDGLAVAERRHHLRHRPRRRVRVVEGRQTPRPHQRRQGHGQLQVRR